VTLAIRYPEVTSAVSEVSAVADVRRRLVGLQRTWVEGHGGSAVVEGRDIGTVVFPEARVKVFLDATPEVRAARRAAETTGSSHVHVAADLARRDDIDSTRPVSPLRPAADAHIIDTTHLDQNQVAEAVLALVTAASGGEP
jgi:cytidylate kinase